MLVCRVLIQSFVIEEHGILDVIWGYYYHQAPLLQASK